MNLNSAVYDNVLAIDQRLQMLEHEVQFMDQQFQYNKLQQPITQEIEMPIQQAPQPLQQQQQQMPPTQSIEQINTNTQAKQKSISKQIRYQNLPSVQVDTKNIQAHKIKHQISKEYASTLAIGRPDLSILEQEFEQGDKFYEPQYKSTDVNIRFRETESQIRHENTIMGDILRNEANQFYDSFM